VAESPFVIEVTRDNYAQVMEASFEVPVLIDFWASWCQPCQVLMPILAKLADEYQGKFVLGKLNTEQEQEIAARFGIRSIPNVKLFRNGQSVDEFMGALPESSVREFIDRHIAGESDASVEESPEHQFFVGEVENAPDAGALDARLASNADDHEALYQLASHKVVAQEYEAALKLLLQLMQTNREFGDDAARQALLKVFDLLGDDPLVRHYRGRMASLLH